MTPEWLTAALRPRHPDAEVTEVHVGSSVNAFTANLRLMLDYGPGGHAERLPATMFLKADFSPLGEPSIVAAPAAREAAYYQWIAERVPVNQPQCFAVVIDKTTGRSALLLEDLLARNVRFGSALAPLTPTEAADGLSQLATVHAHWWQSPALVELDSYPGTLRPVVLSLLSDENWAQALERPSGSHVIGRLRDAAVVRSVTEAMWAFDEADPQCLIHGDPHLGNTFREADGGVGFFDWQASSQGSWAYDVTRYLICSLSVDDRRAHERSLIDSYLESLRRLGVAAPSREEAWTAYRRNVLHALRWLCSPAGNYSEEYVDAYVTRCCTAAEDLDSMASLGT